MGNFVTIATDAFDRHTIVERLVAADKRNSFKWQIKTNEALKRQFKIRLIVHAKKGRSDG